MRATLNKFLLLLAFLALDPAATHGQLPRFFRSSTSRPTQVSNPAAAPSKPVRQVQFEQSFSSPAVPSPAAEAKPPSLTATSSASEETLSPPPAIEDYRAGTTSSTALPPNDFTSAPMDLTAPPLSSPPLSSPPVADPVPFGELVMEPGYGQPHDIPLNDVIPQSADTYSTNDWFRNGNWYSKQEFVMLLRADLPHQHIALDQTVGVVTVNGFVPLSDPNITHSLSTKHVDFTYEAGTRLTLGHRLGRDPANRDHSIEFTFNGLFEFSNAMTMTRINEGVNAGILSLLGSEESVFSSLTGAVGFATQNPIAGLDANNTVDILFRSNFNSFEMNYVIGARPAKDRLVMQPDGRWVRHATPSKVRGLFAGLRYIRQNDFFRYLGAGDVQADGTVDSDIGGNYEVRTDNDLVGIQVGGEFVRKRTEWMIGFKGKVGGLINFADRNNRLSQSLASTATGTRVVSTTVTEESDSEETLAFLGECGAYVAYYVRPNTAFRVGYDAIYINGMATGTANLGIRGDSFARFETTGDSLYHGLNFGLETTW